MNFFPRLLALCMGTVIALNTAPISAKAAPVSLRNELLTIKQYITVQAVTDFNIEAGVLKKYTGTDSTVVIPSDMGIKEIGAEAFKGNSSIREVTVPDGITKISKSAFSACGKLTVVTLPSTLQTIEDEAFRDSISLEQLDLPSGLTSIGRNAFRGNKVEIMNIPDGVTAIPADTFSNCLYLRELTIGKGVENIVISAFTQTGRLEKITVSDSNKAYKSVEGILYTKDMKSLIYYPAMHSAERYEVPYEVETIASTSFQKSIPTTDAKLKTIVIPKTTKSISADSIKKLMALEVIEIHADNTEYLSSKEGLLYNKTAKTLLACPVATKRKNIIIPDTVNQISSSAFRDCENIEYVSVPQGVTSIVTSTFDNCVNLKEIDLPTTLMAISDYAFMGCKMLGSTTGTITLPEGLIEIGTAAFAQCYSLKTIVIPDSVDTILDFAFMQCTSLESIVLSESLLTLGMSTFQSCSSLESVTVPASVKSVGSMCFATTESLTEITFEGKNTKLAEPQAMSQDVKIVAPEDSEASKFAQKNGNEVEVLPEKQVEIFVVEDGVLTQYNEDEPTVIIPNDIGVTSISSTAFKNKTMEEIILPSTLQTITPDVFSGNSSLLFVDVSQLNPNFASKDGILFSKNYSKLYIYPHAKKDTEYTISKTVESVVDKAFKDNPYISKIHHYFDTEITNSAVFNCSNFVGLFVIDPPSGELPDISKVTDPYITIEIPSSTSLSQPESLQLTVDKNFSNDIEWSVSNEKLAQIDENGLLTALYPGTVIVTASYGYDVFDELRMTITPPDLDKYFLYGDVDQDGAITINDAIAIFKYVASIESPVKGKMLIVGDIDQNKSVDIIDALAIFKYMASIDDPVARMVASPLEKW